MQVLPVLYSFFRLTASDISCDAATGIGLALAKQLCKDHGAKVFLGSRNAERGAQAVKAVKDHCGGDASVELVVIDVSSDDSVKAAAKSLQSKSVILDAIVNNAGTGLAHGVSDDEILNVNFWGVKRVCDNFVPLLDSGKETKIVNVGSGAGPMYVADQPDDRKRSCATQPSLWKRLKPWPRPGVHPKTQPTRPDLHRTVFQRLYATPTPCTRPRRWPIRESYPCVCHLDS